MIRSAGKERGASLVEYVMGLGALLGLLLAPVFQGENAIEVLTDAIKREHSAYMHATSLPL